MSVPNVFRKFVAAASLGIAAASGFALVAATSASASTTLLDNWNIYGVTQSYPQPPVPTQFTLTQATTIATISTYHWDGGYGAVGGGYIYIRSDGQTLFQAPAAGSPGQGGVPDADWAATFNITLGPGTYQVSDSNPQTWSYNSQSGDEGFADVSGTPTSTSEGGHGGHLPAS
jgi:hypothetical protein